MSLACCVLMAEGAIADDAASSGKTIYEWLYDPSPLYPFGRANPTQTDPEARIFDRFTGTYTCTQERNDQASGKSTKSDGVWVWYYDMNGFGIRDHYRFNAGAPASQRVYDPAKKEWHVWYFMGQTFYYAGEWIGGKVEDRLVFEHEDEALGGRKVLSRLQFFDITDTSYEWTSSSIDNETGEVFVDWAIHCKKAM